jgi:alpha-glucosidase
VWLQTVHHDGSEKYVSNPYPRFGEQIRLRLRAGEDAPIRRIMVRTCPDGEQDFTPMAVAGHQPPIVWWEAEMVIDQPSLHYRFILETNRGVWWLAANGVQQHEPLDVTDFRILADYDTPDWLGEAVFYQIYPDRFANGDPANDPRPEDYVYGGHRPQTLAWGMPRPAHVPTSVSFYGGDLPGILMHVDHLEALGVNALYLNPVFSAYSTHKYDTIDYLHVDPHLGGDEALINLRRALAERDMHYVLDIVPNHCGSQHPWFLAAQQDPHAPETEFFTFTRHPHEYTSWLGHKSLAKLNYSSPELRRLMYQGQESIFRHWLRPPFSADGYRVDVGNMLGRQGTIQMNAEVIQGMRRAVKDTQPHAYLMGENFYDATAQLQGDQWDGVMNYMGLAMPLWNWLRGYRQGAGESRDPIISQAAYPTPALEASWRQRRATMPWVIGLQMYNLLDSHDTSRIRSVVGGNDSLHRLAVAVQLTYPGVPGIYYGDEIGMEDLPEVPHLRGLGCMVWEQASWNHDLFNFYRDLIDLRRHSPVLQRGGFQMLAVERDTFVYQREGLEGHIIVVAHRGERPRPAGGLSMAHAGLADGTRLVEHFGGQNAKVVDGNLALPEQPQGVTLWETTT